MSHDPYALLGVSRDASEAELRTAYRRLAQLHHPDHNAGSAEAGRRFDEIRVAYLRVLGERRAAAPSLEARIAAMEDEIRSDRDACPPRPAEPPRRASAEELGYVTTDDSFGKILDDLLDRFNSDPGASR